MKYGYGKPTYQLSVKIAPNWCKLVSLLSADILVSAYQHFLIANMDYLYQTKNVETPMGTEVFKCSFNVLGNVAKIFWEKYSFMQLFFVKEKKINGKNSRLKKVTHCPLGNDKFGQIYLKISSNFPQTKKTEYGHFFTAVQTQQFNQTCPGPTGNWEFSVCCRVLFF